MVTLLLLVAVAAGAYWAGTRSPNAPRPRHPDDDAARRPANPTPARATTKPWLLVTGLVLAAVLPLGLLSPATLGIGPIGGPGGIFDRLGGLFGP